MSDQERAELDSEYGDAFDDEQDETGQPDESSGEENDQEPVDTGQGEESAESDPKLDQKYQSWEGRLRAQERRLAEERQRLQETQQSGKDSNEEDASEDDEVDDEELSDLQEDFPELANQLKATRSLIQKERQERERLQDELQQEKFESHQNLVKERHPDAYEIANSGDLEVWLDELPRKTAREYEQVIKNGTADKVVAMLDAYKSDNSGNQPARQKPKNQRSRQAQSLAAVKGTGSGPRPRGKPNPNDYDGAWDEDD